MEIDLLARVLLKEMRSLEVRKLRGEISIYNHVKAKISELTSRISSDLDEVEREILTSEIKLLHQMAMALLTLRLYKAVISGTANLLDIENKALETLKNIISSGEESCKTKPHVEAIDLKGLSLALLRCMSDFSEFVGPEDLKTYGPLREGDLLLTTINNVKPLIRKGIVRVVKTLRGVSFGDDNEGSKHASNILPQM